MKSHFRGIADLWFTGFGCLSLGDLFADKSHVFFQLSGACLVCLDACLWFSKEFLLLQDETKTAGLYRQ